MSLEPTDITLTEEDFATYREKGYWISPVLFDADEVSALRREVARICAGERDYDGFYMRNQPDFSVDDPAFNQITFRLHRAHLPAGV